ncbi:MAG: hypothetical protein QOC87_2019 [Actinomycetota bacterium]|nr:hypothetical protein [Actinomycetota bacterium]
MEGLSLGAMGDRPPPITGRYAWLLQWVGLAIAIIAAYVIGRGHTVAQIFLGIGLAAILVPLATRWTTRPSDRSQLVGTGAVLLGTGFVGIGIYLLAR